MPDYETREYREVRAYYKAAVMRGMAVTCHLCGQPITLAGGGKGRGARGRVPGGGAYGGGALEVDHRVPRAEGGSLTDKSNMAPSHRVCNQRKGNRTMRALQLGRFSRRKRHRSPKFSRKISRAKK